MEESEHLVLRGSVLLKTWFGGSARDPGDLDWVVTPETLLIPHARSRSLIAAIMQRLRGSRLGRDIEILDQPFPMTKIRTYEGAQGIRMLVPWSHADISQQGSLQMDFAFGEPLPSPPVTTRVGIGSFTPIELRTASREQSLAWKLMWLATDPFIQGKDLYDAVLLAESTSVTADLVRATFSGFHDQTRNPFEGFDALLLMRQHVLWDEFAANHPHVEGTLQEWKQRLVNALQPVWAELGDESGSR